MDKCTLRNDTTIWRTDTGYRHYGNKQNSISNDDLKEYTFWYCRIDTQQDKKTLMTSIQQVAQAYKSQGFHICNILADGAFECIRDPLSEMGIALNVMSINQHVPEIERYIRTVKEQVRAIATTIPFRAYPPRLIAKMVYNVVFWLHCFPHKDGVHATISPRTLITGLAIDYNKHCKVSFGMYVQVHKDRDNSLSPRTSGAIALRHTGNDQGGHYFLSLHSGKRINRYAWMELPMPNEVIKQVHRLAEAAEKYEGIVFTNMQGNLIEDQMYDNDANQAYQNDNSKNHDTNKAYQDDKARSDMSN